MNPNKNVRPQGKSTRFYVDNEIPRKFGRIIGTCGVSLYAALAMHAHSQTQECFPSYQTLMDTSGIGNRNTLSKYLKILEDNGLIEIVKNRERKSNLYRLLDCSDERYASGKKAHKQYRNGYSTSTKSDTLSHTSNSDNEVLPSPKAGCTTNRNIENYKEVSGKSWEEGRSWLRDLGIPFPPRPNDPPP